MPTVFFSYCHKDEVFRDQLEIHLSALKRQKAIESWHDPREFLQEVLSTIPSTYILTRLTSSFC